VRRHTKNYLAVLSTVALVLVVAMSGALVVVFATAAQAVPRPAGSSSTTPASEAVAKIKVLNQAAQLFAPDGSTGDAFGWSVSISGSTAVVGAPYATNVNGEYAGTAYVFDKVGTTWSYEATLIAPDGASGDDFGWSVAVSGSTVVVGAPAHDEGVGAAYVFTAVGGVWPPAPQAELACPDPGGGDKFGYFVVASPSTVVVGSDGHSFKTGAAYVFTETGGTWPTQPQHEIVPSDAQLGDEFGWSMSLSGSMLGISAVKHTVGGVAAGAVYLYDMSTWSPSTYLITSDSPELAPPGGTANEYFGDKIALSGSRIVVGAPGHDSKTGAAYVFAGGAGGWTQVAVLTAADGAPGNCFGWDVGLSGRTALVAAELHDSDTGAAYVFKGSGRKWSEKDELTASGGEQGDEFGYSASLSGSTAFLGADQYDPSESASVPYYGTGTAYTFTV
jgi:hypothetical protein